jgi:hypothetical protein
MKRSVNCTVLIVHVQCSNNRRRLVPLTRKEAGSMHLTVSELTLVLSAHLALLSAFVRFACGLTAVSAPCLFLYRCTSCAAFELRTACVRFICALVVPLISASFLSALRHCFKRGHECRKILQMQCTHSERSVPGACRLARASLRCLRGISLCVSSSALACR